MHVDTSNVTETDLPSVFKGFSISKVRAYEQYLRWNAACESAGGECSQCVGRINAFSGY